MKVLHVLKIVGIVVGAVCAAIAAPIVATAAAWHYVDGH